MFRQYAQQMGMQNVRAILPEQIDLLINNSINDVINQVITQNIGTTNDRVITDNSKLNQINALKSLYKVWKGKVTLGDAKTNYIASYELPISAFKSGGTYNNDGVNSTSISYIYIVDLSISYKKDTNFVSNIFPIRIIDDMYLADVVNDFILHPTFRSPVATVHDNTIELYIDKPDSSNTPFKFQGCDVDEIRLSYISKPSQVKFLEDVNGTNVDCDLPEYLHVDIVKHAVELYRTALTGSIAVTQQAQEAQQRENLRNNYRQGDNDNSNR
nr:MAG TPA: hypothetical protein [Crassvirales sp.]